MRPLKISPQITPRWELSLDKYLLDISKLQLITSEEEVTLAGKVKKGDKNALKELVQANLRFVVSVSKQYQNLGMSLPDLINEGNMGLIKAAYCFDETRGFRFISYAVWWIRRAILQALGEQSRMVRIPAHQISILNKLRKAEIALEQQFEREPTLVELSMALKQQPDDINSLVLAAAQAISLDAPINENETTCVSDMLSDSLSPDNNLEYESLRDEVGRAVNRLPRREALIIRLFFGLDGYSQHAVNEIADRLDISVALVRRLKEKALDRLRVTNRNQSLKGFLD